VGLSWSVEAAKTRRNRFPASVLPMIGLTMNSPLTYPDQPRDDNLFEFFLGLIGAFVRKALLELLVCLFEALA
jgi:hypothetical protein